MSSRDRLQLHILLFRACFQFSNISVCVHKFPYAYRLQEYSLI